MSHHRNGLRRGTIATALIALLILACSSSAFAPRDELAAAPRANRSTTDWPAALAASGTSNVILITLDGVRTQEIFGGLDLDVLRSMVPRDAKVEATRAYQRYWAATPEARRERLMPFF